MNNLAKNLIDRLGQPHVGKTISSSQFKENDIVNISCVQDGLKSVHAIATSQKAINNLIDQFRNEIEEEFDMPYDVAIDMHKPYLESKIDGIQLVLLDDDKECDEKQINDQLDFKDKKQSRLNDETIAWLVYRYVVLDKPLSIVGLASNFDEVRRSNIKLVN